MLAAPSCCVKYIIPKRCIGAVSPSQETRYTANEHCSCKAGIVDGLSLFALNGSWAAKATTKNNDVRHSAN